MRAPRLLPDVHARSGGIEVGGVFAPGETGGAAEVDARALAHAQQRADEIDAALQRALPRHAGQPLEPAALAQRREDGLELVVGVVRHRDHTCPNPLCFVGQRAVARLPGRLLQR